MGCAWHKLATIDAINSHIAKLIPAGFSSIVQSVRSRLDRLLRQLLPDAIYRDLGWELTHVYGLTETAPLITICKARPEHQNLPVEELAKIKARQGVELVSSGELRVVDEAGNEVPPDGETPGEITAPTCQ